MIRADAQCTDRVDRPASIDRIEAEIGEGIAGSAWRQKVPVIYHKEDHEPLRQLSDDSGTSIIAALAIPVLTGDHVRSVVVLGFGEGYGGAEVWTREDRDELGLSSSFYSGLPSFEFVTRYSKFPKGAGAPGRIWKSKTAWIGFDPPNNPSFSRSFGNDSARISAAIGFPIGLSHGFTAAVLLLLSDADTPLARGCELWNCRSVAPPADGETPVIELLSSTDFTSNSVRFYKRKNNADVQEDSDNVVDTALWQQELLFKMATARSPLLARFEGDQAPATSSCLLSIPCFDRDNVSAILNLMF